jgi:hypothetical protein
MNNYLNPLWYEPEQPHKNYKAKAAQAMALVDPCFYTAQCTGQY